MSKVQKIFLVFIWNLGALFLCFVRFELFSVFVLFFTLTFTPVVIKKIEKTLLEIQSKHEMKNHP